MSLADLFGVHVDLAGDALDGIPNLTDYRNKGIHLGIAATHAVLALAISVNRFAAAVEPKEDR